MPDAKRVNEIMRETLFKDVAEANINADGVPTDGVLVNAVAHRFGFHKGRLEEYRKEIEEFLEDLPEDFDKGLSFLALCVDKKGDVWGEHIDVEALVGLGMGLGLVKQSNPPDMTRLLPGGVPYFQRVSGKEA